MRTIAIEPSLTGSGSNFLVEPDGFRWSDVVPRGAWRLTGSSKSGRCLDTVLALDRKDIPRPPDRYLRAYSSIREGVDGVPWRLCMPKDVYRRFFYSVVDVASSVRDDYSYDYVVNAWSSGSRVLSTLRPVKVDVDFLREASRDERNASCLAPFEPNRSGYASLPTYERLRTRTGRLTISDGPGILTLPRTLRKVMRSSHDDGRILSIDFSALEPSIILSETRGSVPSGDLYQGVSDALFSGEVSRDDVKQCVISVLYGAGRDSLARSLKTVSPGQVDDFREAVRAYFGVDSLADRLRKTVSGGVLRNRYGRPIFVEDDDNLVSLYTQSTGVDVALQGFESVLRSLDSDGVRPLFVLHDAIVLDVRGDRLPEVSSIQHVDVPGFSHHFNVKVTS